MARDISNLLECVVSTVVSTGGKGVEKGGMGLMKSAAQKIGWAGKDKNKRTSRFASHKLSAHSFAQGFGGGRAEWSYKKYDPKQEYDQSTKDQYNQARMSGSGCVKFKAPEQSRPNNLYGRSSFNVAERSGSIRPMPGQLSLKQKIGFKR